MKKAKIGIIIYQEKDKTKVKFRNKKGKKIPESVKNLYLVLSSKIRDILEEI